MTFLQQQNYRVRKLINGCQGLEMGERLTTKTWGFGVTELIVISWLEWWLHNTLSSLWNYTKMVDFTICQNYILIFLMLRKTNKQKRDEDVLLSNLKKGIKRQKSLLLLHLWYVILIIIIKNWYSLMLKVFIQMPLLNTSSIFKRLWGWVDIAQKRSCNFFFKEVKQN